MKITTTRGEMDDDDPRLFKRTGLVEDENERTDWIEYWLRGETPELVHRSVHTRLKRKPLEANAITGRLG